MSGIFQRFFFDFTITRARLELFRIVFFFLVGLDAFLQIEHAPRYGAGDFNVAHFDILDQLLPLPSREAMMVMFVVQAYLAFRVMAGVTVRASVAMLTALYGFTYFISQVDSYQHHYLMFLVLFLSNFWPWDEARNPGPPNEPIKAWAVRVTMCQVSILYLWTAIAKTDPHWLAGRTLRMQVTDPNLKNLIESLSGSLGVEALTLWAAASLAVTVGELALALGWQVKRLWPLMVPLGWMFHLGVEYAGFKIGLFSYFMVAAYVLILPESWLTAPAAFFARGKNKKGEGKGDVAAPLIKGGGSELAGAVVAGAMVLGVFSVLIPDADRLSDMGLLVGVTYTLSVALQYFPGRWLTVVSQSLGKALGIASDGARTWAFLVVAVVVGSGVLWVMPFSEAPYFVGVIALLGLGLDVKGGGGRLQRALVHILVCAMVLSCHLMTEQALNYYRFMGGDARRRGDVPTAIAAYTQVTVVDPDYAYGHRRLGDLYMRTQAYPKAVESYQRGVDLMPSDPGFLIPLAQAYLMAGMHSEARAIAQPLLKTRLKDKDRASLERIMAQSEGR